MSADATVSRSVTMLTVYRAPQVFDNLNYFRDFSDLLENHDHVQPDNREHALPGDHIRTG